MLIELRKGMTLHPCTFNAVIAPEKVMVSALNNNTDLQRFLFLYVSGNYSRLLSSISRSSKNFEVRRAFTAHQLFTILKEASHTVLLLEHDPTLFEGAENMIPQIAGMRTRNLATIKVWRLRFNAKRSQKPATQHIQVIPPSLSPSPPTIQVPGSR